eukprot:15381548-Alexandrium_andersonii.AAC.1
MGAGDKATAPKAMPSPTPRWAKQTNVSKAKGGHPKGRPAPPLRRLANGSFPRAGSPLRTAHAKPIKTRSG